jgi:actin-related protein
MNRPFGSVFKVRQAKDPKLDAWRGASKWAMDAASSKQINKKFITKADYDEYGADYLVSRDRPAIIKYSLLFRKNMNCRIPP